MDIEFASFFASATRLDLNPYPYQTALAADTWPTIVRIPTGLGKTAGTILSWLFKRHHGDPQTPRRLIYCLPIRVLVEQTVTSAQNWIENLISADIINREESPEVCALMGGEIDADWDRCPEKGAILVGTQDQLLSRALNRGYAMSRFRWPIQFGLLNNDCLWIFDEVQLMGSGLATSAQLQAFR